MIVVADTGALISLGMCGHIPLIKKVFGSFYIANAVWEELKRYDHPEFDKRIAISLKQQVVKINSRNHLSVLMDYGESESVILYEELNADYLLIDDQKARIIAESLEVKCIGSIGLLVKAKRKGLVTALKPTFDIWLKNERFFAKMLLNKILIQTGEEPIE